MRHDGCGLFFSFFLWVSLSGCSLSDYLLATGGTEVYGLAVFFLFFLAAFAVYAVGWRFFGKIFFYALLLWWGNRK